MIRKIIINNQKYDIDQSYILGVGGEASVVKVENFAVKIFHKNTVSQEKLRKLQILLDLSKEFTKYLFMPANIVYDVKNDIVGYTMSLLPTRSSVIQNLSLRSFRKSHPQYNTSFIISLFMNGQQTLDRLHSHNAKIIIGDLNDLNEAFCSTEMLFLDVDSFQVGTIPCAVATENFLDPNLYNIDLSKKAVFKPEHDWYAFLVMFIKSVILTHPYGGFHQDFNTLFKRAINKIPVFDSDVKYPKTAYSYDLLSNNIKELCHKFFKLGERTPIKLDELAEYKNRLIICNSCKIEYPDTQKSCPECSNINTAFIKRQTTVSASSHRKITSTRLLNINGHIIWASMVNQYTICISNENNLYVFYKQNNDDTFSKIQLFAAKNVSSKFAFANNLLVYNEEYPDEEILIFNINNSQLHGIAKRKVGIFNNQSSFTTTKSFILRIQDGIIFKGFMDSAHGYIETKVIDVIKNQSSIYGSSISDYAVCITRYFNDVRFILLKLSQTSKVIQFNANIPEFDDYETIIDEEILFSASRTLILLKTEIRGRTYTRVYIVDLDSGTLISHYRVKSITSESHKKLSGKSFSESSKNNGVFLSATDAGIVQTIIGKDKIEQERLLVESEPFVDENTTLLAKLNGIIAVQEISIDLLTII